jgi:hypothetical protein
MALFFMKVHTKNGTLIAAKKYRTAIRSSFFLNSAVFGVTHCRQISNTSYILYCLFALSPLEGNTKQPITYTYRSFGTQKIIKKQYKNRS